MGARDGPGDQREVGALLFAIVAGRCCGAGALRTGGSCPSMRNGEARVSTEVGRESTASNQLNSSVVTSGSSWTRRGRRGAGGDAAMSPVPAPCIAACAPVAGVHSSSRRGTGAAVGSECGGAIGATSSGGGWAAAGASGSSLPILPAELGRELGRGGRGRGPAGEDPREDVGVPGTGAGPVARFVRSALRGRRNEPRLIRGRQLLGRSRRRRDAAELGRGRGGGGAVGSAPDPFPTAWVGGRVAIAAGRNTGPLGIGGRGFPNGNFPTPLYSRGPARSKAYNSGCVFASCRISAIRLASSARPGRKVCVAASWGRPSRCPKGKRPGDARGGGRRPGRAPAWTRGARLLSLCGGATPCSSNSSARRW